MADKIKMFVSPVADYVKYYGSLPRFQIHVANIFQADPIKANFIHGYTLSNSSNISPTHYLYSIIWSAVKYSAIEIVFQMLCVLDNTLVTMHFVFRMNSLIGSGIL